MQNPNGQSKIYQGPKAWADFCDLQSKRNHRIFLLTDTNTHRDCLPLLAPHLHADAHYTMPAGEAHKTLATCAQVWQALTDARFERGDLLLNLGGGVVCDLGGFVASTFKRGISFVHMPTTLLAMADAAIGGKTGIDLGGYKNQVGSFAQPTAVVVNTAFLQTLPQREARSGYAEVLKHHLIHDRNGWAAAVASPTLSTDWDAAIARAIATKLHFTEADPLEKSIRKALNFGHTVGHALESHFLAQRPADPLLHGEAVAAGMWCEAWLSLQRSGISPAAFAEIATLLTQIYPKAPFLADEIDAIAAWCQQDKKNSAGQIRACLLDGIGGYAIDQALTLPEIVGSLHHYHEDYP
jgi:3-dehydroquinate synthase